MGQNRPYTFYSDSGFNERYVFLRLLHDEVVAYRDYFFSYGREVFVHALVIAAVKNFMRF